MKQLAQFGMAGTVGYLVDAGVLLAVTNNTGPYLGRFLSFAAALTSTWLINRSLTFRHQRTGAPLYREYSLYALTALGGGAVNVVCYSLLVYLFELQKYLLPIAVAVGSLAGMLVNFRLSRAFVFNGKLAGRNTLTSRERS